MSAPNPSLWQRLAEANDEIEYCQEQLEEAEAALAAKDEELAAVKKQLQDTKEDLGFYQEEVGNLNSALDDANADIEEAKKGSQKQNQQLFQSRQAIISAQKKHQGELSALKAEHEQALAAMRAEQDAAIAAIRKEQLANEESSLHVTLESDLEAAKACIEDLQLQQVNLTKEVQDKNVLVTSVTKDRDAAQRELVSATTSSSERRAEIDNLTRIVAEITASRDAALTELSATSEQLRGESSAKDAAQVAVQEFQDQFASIEAMVDDAINSIGCADTFAYESKLDYISASANAVITLLAQRDDIYRELLELRTAKEESGMAQPDVQEKVDSSIPMSEKLEAELRDRIRQQQVVIDGQVATISKQSGEVQVRGAEVVNLQIALKRRDEQVGALGKQLAREQTRATELQELESRNALLTRKLDLASPRISSLEETIKRRDESLGQLRGEKERTAKLLAETEMKLEEVKEQSTFRRTANKDLLLRIDNDAKLIAKHDDAMETLKGEITDLKAKIRETNSHFQQQLGVRHPRPSPQQLAEIRRGVQFAMEVTLKNEMCVRVRKELEDAFSAEMREDLKAEVAREFADLERARQDEVKKVLYQDNSSQAAVVDGLGISPIHISLSESGVESPTTSVPHSTTGMRSIATIVLVVLVSLVAFFFRFFGLRSTDESVARSSELLDLPAVKEALPASKTINEFLPPTRVLGVASPISGAGPTI
jgi:chromosome segregation ATPase